MKEQIQRTFGRANYQFAGNNEYNIELEWFDGKTFYGLERWYLSLLNFKEEFNQLLLLYLILSKDDRTDINNIVLDYLTHLGLSTYNEGAELVTKLYNVFIIFHDKLGVAYNVYFNPKDLSKLNKEEILEQLLKLLEDYDY